jgi:hypothetical protein
VEAALLRFQHVGQRLGRGCLQHGVPPYASCQIEGVNSFLQHALLVPQNHFRADFNQALEAIVVAG